MSAKVEAGRILPSPFYELNARRDALRELKRAVVKLGNSGDRRALKLARMLFTEIPGLRSA